MAKYSERRSPFGHGRHFPDLVFDRLPYFDVLLDDLGLKYWRKRSLWKEVFQMYGSEDYRGVVEEWVGKNINYRGVEKRR